MHTPTRRVSLAALIAIGALAGAARAQELTDADLNGKPFMHQGTFAGADSGGWARNDLELEGAFTVKCVPYPEMYKLLRQGSNGEALRGILSEDDNTYRELRRPSICDAFSIGYPIDEIPWDNDRHQAREALPYIWLMIEQGNFDIDERRNKRMISLGTDLMDDTYYDTRDWLLLSNRFTIRGRKRWDTPTELRRLLIGFKAEAGVDANGVKNSAKVDIRTDSGSAEEALKMDEWVMSGMVGWDGSPEVAVPCRELYRRLAALPAGLPDTATYKDVLFMEPKVFLRSIRSRYHLNECRLDAVKAAYDLGATRLKALVALSREARMANAVPAAKLDAVRAWEDKVAKVLDRTLVAERAAARLRAIDPTLTVDAASITSLMPEAAGIPAPETLADIAAKRPVLEQRKVVAEVVSELYHELSKGLDDGSSESLRRIVSRAMDRTVEAHAEWWKAHLLAKDIKTFGPKTTWEPFLEALRATIGKPAAEKAADLAAYNKFGTDQKAAGRRPFRDFFALTEAQLDALVFQISNEQHRLWLRQLECAGTAARGLWFDQARELYIPDSDRAWGNFMIDTMDFTTSWPASVWDGTPPAERTMAVNPPEDKLLHATLVNELQIELTAVGDYTSRVRRLGGAYAWTRAFMKWCDQTGAGSDWKAAHDKVTSLPEAERDAALAAMNALVEGGSPVSAEDFEAMDPALFTQAVKDGQKPKELQVAYEGAKWVFEQYQLSMNHVSKIKGPKVLEVLEDRGGPSCMEWAQIEASKGETALRLERTRNPGVVVNNGGNGGGLIAAITSPTNTTYDAAAPAVRDTTTAPTRLQPGRLNFYKITLQPGQKVRFVARFKHAQGNLDLRLVRRNGTKLASSETTGDTETIEYRALNATTVYLRVYGVAGAGNSYTLETR